MEPEEARGKLIGKTNGVASDFARMAFIEGGV
jgi:hypothetical protein